MEHRNWVKEALAQVGTAYQSSETARNVQALRINTVKRNTLIECARRAADEWGAVFSVEFRSQVGNSKDNNEENCAVLAIDHLAMRAADSWYRCVQLLSGHNEPDQETLSEAFVKASCASLTAKAAATSLCSWLDREPIRAIEIFITARDIISTPGSWLPYDAGSQRDAQTGKGDACVPDYSGAVSFTARGAIHASVSRLARMAPAVAFPGFDFIRDAADAAAKQL